MAVVAMGGVDVAREVVGEEEREAVLDTLGLLWGRAIEELGQDIELGDFCDKSCEGIADKSDKVMALIDLRMLCYTEHSTCQS